MTSENKESVIKYFMAHYPECGTIFYEYALNNIVEKVQKDYLTLSGISECIKEEPFILKYIFCVDARCTKSSYISSDKGNHVRYMLSDVGGKEVYLCYHPMNHDWFRHTLQKIRDKLRREKKKDEPCKVYAISLGEVRDALCREFHVAEQDSSLKKIEMIWVQVRDGEDSLLKMQDFIDEMKKRGNPGLIRSKDISHERMRQIIVKMRRLKKSSNTRAEHREVEQNKTMSLSRYSLNEQEMADRWISLNSPLIEEMVRDKWSSHCIREKISSAMSKRALGILTRAHVDIDAIFSPDLANEFANIKGMGRASLFEIEVTRLIYQRIMELYGTELYGESGKV